ARVRNLRNVCMADKANVLTFAHGLWRRVFALVAKDYPGMTATTMYVDALAMDLIRRPERYEVIVTNNLFGDILTDLGAALTGGLGLAASGNIHPGKCSLFEPVHGSAPDIAGKGVANPIGSLLSLALLLEHVGEPAAAARVDAAVRRVLRDGDVTRD